MSNAGILLINNFKKHKTANFQETFEEKKMTFHKKNASDFMNSILNW